MRINKILMEEAIEYNKNLKEYMRITDKESEYKFLKENYVALDMAIKVLEQEPCEDAISRADALKNLALTNNKDDVYRMIQTLPPVTPTQRWIPVSERLPLLKGSYEKSDDVLITDGDEIDIGYLVNRTGEIVWHYYGSEYEVSVKDEDNDAIAWMPLPEPYKVESEG